MSYSTLTAFVLAVQFISNRPVFRLEANTDVSQRPDCALVDSLEKKPSRQSPLHEFFEKDARIEEARNNLKDFVFGEKVSNYNELKEFRDKFDKFAKNLEDKFSNVLSSSDWESIANDTELQSYLNSFWHKFRDEILLRDGIAVKSHCKNSYIIYFESDKVFKFSPSTFGYHRMMRYKMEFKENFINYSPTEITNAKLVFLNKNGFELFSENLGNLKRRATGHFEISEKLYQEIDSESVLLICDQDY